MANSKKAAWPQSVPAATGTVADNGGNLNLKYFTPAEFGSWWPMMSADLLNKLDKFRELWGYPVEISPVDGSRGRHLGPNDLSMHNVDHWGLVRAVGNHRQALRRPPLRQIGAADQPAQGPGFIPALMAAERIPFRPGHQAKINHREQSQAQPPNP